MLSYWFQGAEVQLERLSQVLRNVSTSATFAHNQSLIYPRLSKNRCSDKEVEVTTTTVNPADGTSCWTGHMSLCCDQTESDSEIDKCSKWKLSLAGLQIAQIG